MTTPAPETLLLIDVMPLLYRGHFAFVRSPRMTTDGLNTSALYIFTTLVTQMLADEGATHAALAMDTSPTFRHERFPEYKAKREKMPEDIADSIPMSEEFAAAMNLPFITLDGFEADDVIGTLADRGEKAGMRVLLFTPDKDFAQLVTENITLCRPGKGPNVTERLGVAEVCAAWEIDTPARMVDLLALAGDSSDNIPGIPGVGPKTAVKLLREFGDLEGVLANAGQLKGAVRDRVLNNSESAILSRWLAEIRRDAPLPLELEELRIRAGNTDALAAFCDKYELRTLARKLSLPQTTLETSAPPLETSAPPLPTSPALNDELPLFAALAKQMPDKSASPGETRHDQQTAPDAAAAIPAGFASIHDTPHSYTLCDDMESIRKLTAELLQAGQWAFDTETSGLDILSSRLVGISFSIAPGTASYLPVPQDPAEAKMRLAELQPVFSCKDTLKIGHNLKFDLAVLKQAGIEVAEPMWDTMLAHYVIDPAARHGLDFLAQSLLKYQGIPITAILGEKGPQQLTMDQVPTQEVCEYASEDADMTLRLYHHLKPLVKESGAERALEQCDNALLPVLLCMEAEGVRIDTANLKLYSTELALEIESLEKQIYAAAGTSFNVASPKQLGTILFDYLKLPPKGTTPTGQYITSEDVLSSLVAQHPIIPLILEYRTTAKLKSTYVDKLPTFIRPETGRIHTTFNQALTETGRLSSDNPNLQNIPIRTEKGRRIRAAFIARDDGHVLLSADYSQIELRVMAALSGDPILTEAFRKNADIHVETAARVNDLQPEFVTPEMRNQAKMVNFGIIYGISAFGLGQRLGISRTEAAKLIDAYFSLYPAVKEYMDSTVEKARKDGSVGTLMGRRRPLRDINSRNATLRTAAERVAINTPVQGTAADLIKLAMVAVHREMVARRLKSRLILQVHDELVLDVPLAEVEEVRELVTRCMTDAMEIGVPILVEVGVGKNWLEAH